MFVTDSSPPLFTDERDGFFDLKASAQLLDGFIVNQDFNEEIGRYLVTSDEITIWPLITKELSTADNNQEILDVVEMPTGFIDKYTTAGLIRTPSSYPAADLSDPGERNKAGGGSFKLSHYAQSLDFANNRPYGNTLNTKTFNLYSSACKLLERSLIHGDASLRPMEFNGWAKQMPRDHAFWCDTRVGDKIAPMLRGVAGRAVGDEVVNRKITHIFSSVLGTQFFLEEEASMKGGSKLSVINYSEVPADKRAAAVLIPGSSAPVPIVPSKFIRDGIGRGNGADGQPAPDYVDFWLIDMSLMKWKGVPPIGGTNADTYVNGHKIHSRFDPQFFEIADYKEINPLVRERMVLFYGTLKCLNRGQGIWQLRVFFPQGTVAMSLRRLYPDSPTPEQASSSPIPPNAQS
jgi:hypothetical protein